jgi:hypothetical protein
MDRRSLWLLNCVLLLLSVAAFAYLGYRQWEFRPQSFVGSRHNCDEFWTGLTAAYLAQRSEDLINSEGSFSSGRELVRRACESILREETWKDSPYLHFDAAGEPCDSTNAPYELSVAGDRVIVTSGSSYSFYFARYARPARAE